MTDVFEQTAEFNSKIIGHKRPPMPVRLGPDRKKWTLTALREELQEYEEATTIEDEADALGDLIYFAAGRFHEMGIDGAEVFREIHAANMNKERGSLAKRGDTGYDAIKPEGWSPPNIRRAIYGMPKLLVLGYGRHGKDTVCEMLRDRHGYRFQSSSMFCAERVCMPHFNSAPYLPSYDTVEACYGDRHGETDVSHLGLEQSVIQHRAIWYDLIRAYNIPDGARLAREMLREYDVYCGMRSDEELDACLKAGLFDLIVWVDRSQHEPEEDKSSCTVNRWHANYVVDNNGSLEDLEREVDKLAAYVQEKTS